MLRPSSPLCSLAELGLDADRVTLIAAPLLRLPEKLSSLPGALWLNTKIAGVMLDRVIKKQVMRMSGTFAGCVVHGGRYMGLALPLWRRHVDGGTSLVLHGVDPFLTNVSNERRARRLFNAAGSRCDAVVLVGRPLHAHAVAIGLPEDKLHVIANGTDLPDLAAVSDSQRTLEERRRIVSVSSLIALKGIDDNLRALADIARRRPKLDWEYRVIGDGDERQQLESLARQLGIAGRVHFLGRMPYRETLREIADADIFSLPSWGEAFGIVYLEAMARKRPAIGCLENGAADIITHGHDGLLVPPRNVAELARALESLIENPDLSRQLGQQARTTAEGYSWDHNARHMLERLGIDKGRWLQ
jgi:glycosyltransferase involved in cell wall biosynthesis